jgi:L-malate glycosyltransferase
MEPISVTVVAPSLRYVGGQAVQADLLRRHWENDSELKMKFVPIDPELPRGLAWVQRIRYLRTLARIPFFLAAVWRGISRADIVHIFSASYWSFLLAPTPAWLIARLLGKKSIINYRSGEAPDHLRNSSIARAVLRRVDKIVVPSQYLVDVFEQYDLTAEAVPNIVDLARISYRPRVRLHPWLICTRMFEPYYQVDLVVRAFAEVVQAFPESRLCLVGSGSLEKDIRALAVDLGVGNIEFAGTVPRHEIGRYYDNADIFVNASRLDNMPVSVLEAFASGTPVVTTAPDGMCYLVEHERTGLLCEPGDWRAIAENVMRLLREPELASRLSQSAFLESERYRWTTVRRQWLDVYRSLYSGQELQRKRRSVNGRQLLPASKK